MEIVKMVMPIIIIVILGFGAFWGFIRKLHRTLFRFAFLLLAMGAAFLLAKMCSGAVSHYVFELLVSANIDGLTELLHNSEAAELAEALCRVLANPVLFLIFYIVLKPISWIPYKIFAILFGIKGPRFLGHLSGALAGLLCGLVGLIVFVTPVFGYINLASDTIQRLFPEEEIPEEFNVVLEMTETPVAAQAHSIVGKHLFTHLTTTSLGEDEFSLEGEIDALIVAVDEASVLLDKSPEEYGPTEAIVMESLAHDVGRSHILSSLLSSFLSEASTAWLDGREAFGTEMPEMGEEMQGIMNAFFKVFSTSDSHNIEGDLTTFAKVFRIFIQNDMLVLLSDEGDSVVFVEKLVSDGVVVDLYDILDENPRMQPVKAAIIDTGMRVMLDHLGVSENLGEDHGELMEEIVTTMQNVVKEDGTLDMPALNDGLQEALQSKDIEISDEVVQIVADGLADVYSTEELENLTMSELVDKLIDRFADAELPEDVTVPNDWQGTIPQY